LLSACEHATDVRRAEQWLAVAGRSVAWTDFVPPTCKLDYGGILIATGRWAEAEEQLLNVVHAFERGHRAQRSSALARLAGLRARQGRFEEAERLLEGDEWDPTARRVLVMVALGRGDVALAQDRACLYIEVTAPSDPALGLLLELLVEAQLARGDHRAAAATLDRLIALAGEFPADRTVAAAELAAGRVRAAEGDERASSHLQVALEGFSASACRSKPRGRGSTWPRCSPPGRPTRPALRRAGRCGRSRGWVRFETPTAPPPCSVTWEPPGGRGRGARAR
jgi:hypothetical protein